MSELFCCGNCAAPAKEINIKKMRKEIPDFYGDRVFFVGRCTRCGKYSLVEDDGEGDT